MPIDIDRLAELTFANRDPQFEDPDAEEENALDKYLDGLHEVFDALDNLTGDLDKLIDMKYSKNLVNALGAVNRAMEYIDKEL